MGRASNGSRSTLDAPVDTSSCREEGSVAGEHGVVEAPTEPVRGGNAQVGSSPSLRLQVRTVHDVGRETGLAITLEEVELARTRELDLACELAPVLRAEDVGAIDDLAEHLRRHVAAEVHALVAEPTHDGEVRRREIHEEGAALVRAGRVPLGLPAPSCAA
jgi:hypothetical protein